MGIPRSGTTWAFNVLRGICDIMDQEYETMNPLNPLEVDEVLRSISSNANAIVHFHDVTQIAVQFATGRPCVSFFNFRDPRDVVVSQMHLHDVSFEDAIRMTGIAFTSFQAAIHIPRLMVIPYTHLINYGEAIIFQMGVHLGRFLTPREIKLIEENTSILRHREMMEKINRGELRDSDKIKVSFGGKRNIKSHTETLITDRHIQSGESGRWKNELDHFQQEEINRIFGPVVKQLGLE